MKITINILPQEKKDAIVLRGRKFSLIRSGAFLVIILLFANIILGTVVFFINREKKVAKENLENIETKENVLAVRALENEFKKINGRISLLSTIASQHTRWYFVVDKISNNSKTHEIGLTEIAVDGYTLKIAGISPTREKLLSLKEVFLQDKCFSDVSIPLADLVERSNVRFEISAKVAIECVKK